MKPRVWAPLAGAVDLVVEPAGERRPMRGGAGGWFVSDNDLAPGTDYRFALDGGDPLPDPRSRWQPAGVDGPSRVDDPESFEWTDTGWTGIDPAEL
ncbi:MAG: malto-oligosyltrehalose trehalohydrolase, partial [Actinobacteria bacterium]|nr:malto-oligosyltrehalose trehalohydrolase [Actinomycetota bacterium]